MLRVKVARIGPCYGVGMQHDNAAPPYDAGPAIRVTLNLPADIARALDAWIATRWEHAGRNETIVNTLRDYLTAMGCLPFADEPEGRSGWH